MVMTKFESLIIFLKPVKKRQSFGKFSTLTCIELLQKESYFLSS